MEEEGEEEKVQDTRRQLFNMALILLRKEGIKSNLNQVLLS